MTPPLTDEQKERFLKAFEQIIRKAPIEVQNQWTGHITWVVDIPYFPGNVHLQLKGRLAHEYAHLTNQRLGRTI